MATSAQRDVKMTLSIETLGEEGIKDLQKSIEALAKEGGEAAPEFQRLADEIARLGEQNDALNNFTALADATRVLSDRQTEAQASSTSLAARLDELRAATDAVRLNQQQASEALLAGQRANTEAAVAIRTLKAEYDNAGKQTAEYRTRLRELIAAQGQSQTALIDLRNAQQQANTEVRAAAAEQKKAEVAYARSAAALDRANTALAQNTTEAAAAATAARALGIATDDIAGAQTQLVTSLNAAGAAAQALVSETQALAQASERTAQAQRDLAAASQAGMSAMQQEVSAALALDASFEALRRSIDEYEAARQKATQDANAWQREADGIVDAANSARTLARETEVLVSAQRELASIRAFEKQAADARKLLQAAEYVQFWTNALRESEAATKQVQAAFNTLNVRSADTITAELNEVRAALETVRAQATQTGSTMAGAFTAGRARVNALELELRQLNGTLTTGDRLAGLFKNSLGQIAAGNLIADGVGFLVNKVKELGITFVTTIAKNEQFRRGLNAIYKDAAVTASQIAFLQKTTTDAGVAIDSVQGAFVKFSASTKSANIPLAQTNALFAAVTNAAGTLGLNGEQVTGMLEALGQMAAKGTVSMEELRQQLGDRLPGALSLVAQGLGVTEAQLIKLVESGGLAARDLFPALTKALGTMKGEVTGLTPAYENLKNVLTLTAQSAGDAGWTDILTGALKALTAAAGLVVLPLSALMEIIFGLARAAGVLAGAIATATNPTEELGRIAEEAAARQSKLNDAFEKVIFGAPAAAEAVITLATATARATASSKELTATTLTTAAGQEAQALQATLAATANGNLAATYVQLNARLDENLAVLSKQSEARDKEAKAVKVEGDAMVQLTALRGSERETLEAQTVAANNNLAALQRAADAHRAETEVLLVKRDSLLQLAAVTVEEAKAREQDIVKINQKVEASKAEAQQADAAAASARNEALARQVQRQTYEDNAAALGTLERAMLAANATAEAVNQQMVAGFQTTEQYAAAQRNAAAATALYNDALADTVVRIKAESDLKQANLNITQAGLSVQATAYERLAQAARASGDLAQATYYEIEAKRVQIQVTQAVAEAKRLEAGATIAAANAELDALQKTNSLTEVKRLEIEARIANAKAKQVEAGASADIVRALEAEINAIRNNANARSDGTRGIDRDTASRYKNADSVRAQTAALSEQKVTSDGFKANADGSAAGTFNNSLPMDKAFEIIAKKQKGTLTPEDLADAAVALQQAQNANDWLRSVQDMSAGAVNPQTIFETSTMVTNLKDAIASLKGQQTVAAAAESSGAAAGSASTGPGKGGSSHTVKVDLGGRTRTINTASASDASALVSMLRDLETAAGRAS